MVYKLQQYNLRNCGSTWAKNLIERHLPVEVSTTEKHEYPTIKDDVDGYMVMMKNPYAWCVSQGKFTNTIKNLNRELWRERISTWAFKNKVYYDFVQQHGGIIIHYEDVFDSPEKLIDDVARYVGYDYRGSYYEVKGRSNGGHFDPDYYKFKCYLDELPCKRQLLKTQLKYHNVAPIVKELGYGEVLDW